MEVVIGRQGPISHLPACLRAACRVKTDKVPKSFLSNFLPSILRNKQLILATIGPRYTSLLQLRELPPHTYLLFNPLYD